MKIKTFLSTLAAATVGFTHATAASADSPNVVIIMMDDMGWSDWSCLGSKINKTPNVDRLAAEGMVLRDYYGSPACTPTRTQLMTGCYPRRVGMDRGSEIGVLRPGDPIGLNPDEKTLPKIFQEAGYTTAMVGKWHLGDQRGQLPWDHGFEHYFGSPFGHHGSVHDHPAPVNFPPFPVYRDGEILDYCANPVLLTDWYTDEAVAFIESRKGEKNPFFLYLAHHLAHVPIYPGFRFLNKADWDAYPAAVAHADWSVGEVLKALDRAGLSENTLVIFTNDNGPFLPAGGTSEPFRGGKGKTTDGGVRLPCMVRWPAVIEPGSTATQVTSMMDWVPTFANMLGVALPNKVDGVDIGDMLRSSGKARESVRNYFCYNVDKLEAVRSGRWKYHFQKGELFDVTSDPGESENVAGKNHAVVERLKGYGDQIRAEIGDGLTGIDGNECRPPGRVDPPVLYSQPIPKGTIYNPYRNSRKYSEEKP
jgi:arylsulfatase A-like enzyme